MNEHAQKWVEALRSGEFEQGMGALRKEDSYCCLGVACELFRRETGDGEWASATADPTVADPKVYVPFAVDGYEMVGELPGLVSDWLGLKTESGAYATDGGVFTSLARRNDEGATFEQIAAIIESEPDGLFQGEAGS